MTSSCRRPCGLSRSAVASIALFVTLGMSALALAEPDRGEGTRISAALAQAVQEHRANASRFGVVLPESGSRQRARPSVAIDAVARQDGNELSDALRAIGMHDAERHGRLVSGHLPEHRLGELDGIESLLTARVAGARFAAGAVTTEGERGTRSNAARDRFGVDGEGVTVGVISDSYDCLGGAMADIASGDLPADSQVLREADDCEDKVDEGRALMQIVHDIAPGADLVFRSGAVGTAAVANAILELAQAGAHVVVDDVSLPTASWFQHGPTARAVQRVEAQGVVHVTAAGNEARLSYDSDFRESSSPSLNLRAHDFDPGPADDVLQAFELPEGELLDMVLQWDDPAISNEGSLGAASDLDLYVTDESGLQLLDGAASSNTGLDPVESLTFFNPPGSGQTRFNLLIVSAAGPSPVRLKYIVLGRFGGSIAEHATDSSTVVGHANTAQAIAVGAADHALIGDDDSSPPLREFSSAGGTPILFDDAGARFVEPVVAMKPDVVAPDGVSTTFFRSDADGPLEFNGTSAAAPHVAGVVALLLDADENLTPTDVRALLATSARDVVERAGEGPSQAGPGFDTDSGYGLIDAEAAVALALTGEIPAIDSVDTVPAREPDKPVSVGVGTLSSIGFILLLVFGVVRAFHPRLAAGRGNCRHFG